MSNILDQLSNKKQFVPATPDEYLALQFAIRLKDEAAIGRYIHYVSHQPISHLFRVLNQATGASDPALFFHSSLKSTNS